MAKVRMNFKQWHKILGEPIPLRFIPALLHISREELLQAIKSGRLRLVTFTADDGKIYRMVRRKDVVNYHRKPMAPNQLMSALRRLMAT